MCLRAAIQKPLAALLSFSITQGVFGSKWIVCREHFILYIPLSSLLLSLLLSPVSYNAQHELISFLMPFILHLLHYIS